MKTKTKKKAHYVDGAALTAALVDWKKACKKADQEGVIRPRPSEFIGACVIKICTELAGRYNFAQYSYRDEFISDGIEACINAIKNFNPAKGKAFDYLTMVAFRANQRRILIERKQSYIKHKNYVHRYTMANIDGQIHEGGIDNEYTSKVIDDYEAKHILTKTEKKPKMGGIVKFISKDSK